MYIHDLNPIAFKIFNFKVYWYSLSYLFGFIFSYFYAKYLITNHFIKINFKSFEDYLSWAVIGVVLGGRMGYVIFYNFEFYEEYPLEILKIWKGGMSFHGGLLGVLLSVYLYSKYKKVDFIELSNLVTACAPFGLLLGRLANFVNGELIGRPTNSNWGVLFNENDVLRHPSQIYEAFFEGLIILLVIFLVYKKRYHTSLNVSAIFLIMYGSFRIVLETFREPDNHLGLIFMSLTMGQLLCLPMIFLGLTFIKYKK